MEATASKIFVRPDGTKYEIQVNLALTGISSNVKTEYEVSVKYRKKGKIKWTFLGIGWRDDHNYRALNMEQRREFDKQEILKYVTAAEILEVKMALWNSIKPQF